MKGDMKSRSAVLDVRGYMTLGKAARLLGMVGKYPQQQLRRMLLRKEQTLGSPIMLRGAGTKHPKLFVTTQLLWQYCPELFNARDEMVEVVRLQMQQLEDTLSDLAYRDGVIVQQLAKMGERVDRIEKGIVGPAKAVARPAEGVAAKTAGVSRTSSGKRTPAGVSGLPRAARSWYSMVWM